MSEKTKLPTVERYKITKPLLLAASLSTQERIYTLDEGDIIAIRGDYAVIEKCGSRISKGFIELLPLEPMPNLRVQIFLSEGSTDMRILVMDYQAYSNDEILAEIKNILES